MDLHPDEWNVGEADETEIQIQGIAKWGWERKVFVQLKNRVIVYCLTGRKTRRSKG